MRVAEEPVFELLSPEELLQRKHFFGVQPGNRAKDSSDTLNGLLQIWQVNSGKVHRVSQSAHWGSSLLVRAEQPNRRIGARCQDSAPRAADGGDPTQSPVLLYSSPRYRRSAAAAERRSNSTPANASRREISSNN